MKKHISLLAALLVMAASLSLSGCAGNNRQETSSSQPSRSVSSGQDTSVEEESHDTSRSSHQSEPSPAESSSASEISKPPEPSSPVRLPEGVSRVSASKLRYTSSVLSLSATFPDEFCILNTDYIPKYGIYLQNTDGTATLLAESVEDTTLTYRQMSEYLKSRYPDARVYTTDQKDVVCRMTTTDQSGNEIYVFQRIKMKNGGYNEIALCCRPEDISKYERSFNETSLA